jgi:hypothetical protein
LRTTIADRMRTGAGTAAITTADALVAALRALDTRKLAMLSPYVPGPHRREIEFITSYGFTVVAEAALGIDTNTEIAALRPDELRDFVIDNRHVRRDRSAAPSLRHSSVRTQIVLMTRKAPTPVYERGGPLSDPSTSPYPGATF